MRSRELVGYERTQVVDEHLAWLNGRLPSEALRQLEQDTRHGDSPIATWARGHRFALAHRRIWTRGGRNTKAGDVDDDAPPLIDEVE